jgi:hypothetical protein
MSKSKIIMELADNFRKEDTKKEHSIKGIDKEGNPKQYVIGTIRNVRNERFYRADLSKSGEKIGIPAVRFRPGVFGADPEERGKIGTIENVLGETDRTSPYVHMTTDLNLARRFLEVRMQETGKKVGYIYEFIPETYLNARNVLTRSRDMNPAKEHGMNKNKEVLVAGWVKPEEITNIHTIKVNPSHRQSREHQREVLRSQIKEEEEKLKKTD